MPQSYIEYTSGLTGTTFSVPFKYISVDDVHALGYDGAKYVPLTVSSRSTSAKTITLSVAPSSLYTKLRVYRSTSTTQLVDFQNGSRLSESDLDTAYQQGLFAAQEISENASTNIEGIGPQGPQGIQGVAGNDGADGADASAAIPDAGAVGAYSWGRPLTIDAIAIGATSTAFHTWQQTASGTIMFYNSSGVNNGTTSSQAGTWKCMSGCATSSSRGFTGLWLRIS